MRRHHHPFLMVDSRRRCRYGDKRLGVLGFRGTYYIHPLAKLIKILIPTGGMEIHGHKDVSHLHVSGSV
jgi:hypothetical protein